MSIFKRIFKIGEAKANQIVDSLEKPELMLEQAIKDKEKQIMEAKKSVQGCIATERQTKAQLDKEREQQSLWENKAEMALKGGNEELAAKALARSGEHEQRANGLQTTWEAQRKDVDILKQEIRKFEDEIAEYKRNKDFIIAQSKSAEVKKQIYEAKANMKKNSADDLMARMKAKAERSQYEAEAAHEMSESGGDSLEKEFENLNTETQSSAVQDKLAALKQKINSNS